MAGRKVRRKKIRGDVRQWSNKISLEEGKSCDC